MLLLEHQAKRLLREAGFKVPASVLCSRGSSPVAGQRLPAVVKAQTPFGKRLELGGIRFANTETELHQFVSELFKEDINGFSVDIVLIEERIPYEGELYVSLSYDNQHKSPVLLFSTEGGTNIEEMALVRPEALWKLVLKPSHEIFPHHLIRWLTERKVSGIQIRDLSQILGKLIKCFYDWDALLLEINPLVCSNGSYYALDCHIEIDDDALFRHDFENLFEGNGLNKRSDSHRQSDLEALAREIDGSDYRGVAGRLIEFPGNLGLLIGGGGASLTIFDAILRFHGTPANYCEIGGNPTPEKVAKLTELIVTQPRVEKLAVIMNVVNNTQADVIAMGVIEGLKRALKNPRDLIVMFRIPGSFEERCCEILSQHGIQFTGRSVTIDEAAQIAVEATKEGAGAEIRQ